MKKKTIIWVSAIAAVLILIAFAKGCKKQAANISFETTVVKKGTVSNTVTATGTVQAIKTVSVGTQVSGVIDKIYVDYNSHVKTGQLLAQIDTRTLQTSLENAEANMENAQAEMTLQTANFNRIKALNEKSLVSQNDYEQALYNYTRAEAALKTAKLEYNRAKINLNYASITSPIDGVVLERAVDEGQTVAASFNTPTLFSIANDLTQMQVEASIDEADIGKIKEGQRVSFTVDAFSDLKFEGKVTQVRLQPVTKSNVVTYTVIVKAPNPDYKLMPGMTASIKVFVEEAIDVLTVSSKALHFTPDMAVMEEYKKSVMKKKGPDKEAPKPEGMPDGQTGSTKHEKPDSTAKIVWLKKGEMVFPVPVKIGIDDDMNAQVISGLKEGDEVITAINSGSTVVTKGTSSSPFMPKPPSQKSGSNPPRPQ
ncbi:MAG TPA: efflux RND transporter periplasmic adaptor subunit [Bacteroidales bacterium]|nr:efflux RND transporter periplasmic adaptor subunit [Bacteroidales bacterium]